MKNLFFLCILALIVISSCKKEEPEEPFILPLVGFTLNGKRVVKDGVSETQFYRRSSGFVIRFDRTTIFIEDFAEGSYALGGNNINEISHSIFYSSYASDEIIGTFTIEEIDETENTFSGKFEYTLEGSLLRRDSIHEVKDGKFVNIPTHLNGEWHLETSLISFQKDEKNFFFWDSRITKNDEVFQVYARNTFFDEFFFDCPFDLPVGRILVEDINDFRANPSRNSVSKTEGYLDVIENNESYMEINFNLELIHNPGDTAMLKNGNLKYFKKS